MTKNGLVHVYCGDGKGKTTAAVGLAVRAAGSGKRVLFGQFFKSGSSSEMCVLEKIPEITVCRAAEHYGRYANMNGEQRTAAERCYRIYLSELLNRSRDFDVLVLDEIFAACRHNMVDKDAVLAFLGGEHPEVVMTGREPDAALCEYADYITEMKKLRHPYDRGIAAREGIEY